MKRCPECRRDYYDDSLLYCLDDGNALLEGPASRTSEPGAVATGFFSSVAGTARRLRCSSVPERDKYNSVGKGRRPHPYEWDDEQKCSL